MGTQPFKWFQVSETRATMLPVVGFFPAKVLVIVEQKQAVPADPANNPNYEFNKPKSDGFKLSLSLGWYHSQQYITGKQCDYFLLTA